MIFVFWTQLIEDVYAEIHRECIGFWYCRGRSTKLIHQSVRYNCSFPDAGSFTKSFNASRRDGSPFSNFLLGILSGQQVSISVVAPRAELYGEIIRGEGSEPAMPYSTELSRGQYVL